MGESEGAQQFCLRWNNHSDSILSEFETLLGQEDFVDVTLSCDKLSMKAHRVVLSACSSYFSRLLKENPCQHPIIILRDVGYKELTAILYFMYHGQVMVEQERIPQLLQTAQLLEVRGLCEIREGESGVTMIEESKNQLKDSSTETKVKGANNSFLAGLLGTNISATKRTISVIDTNSYSNSSPTPPAVKKQKSSRPVPMLQSILSQQLAVPITPTFDLTKTMGSSTRALSALASKVQANSNSIVSTSSSIILPNNSMDNMIILNSSMGGPSSGGTANDNSFSHGSSSSSDEANEKDVDKVESSFGEMDSRSGLGGISGELEPDTIMEIKEEPLLDFEDEFCDDNTRGGGSADDDGMSESETELSGMMNDNSHGPEPSMLPLLAQHLSSPSLLTASAKLRAAASQARNLSITSSSIDSPLMTQVILSQPSTPPEMGPASMRMNTDAASPSGEPPRKLAFHEPRPCPICRRMYRDAATLRTHTAIMHAEGRDPFACLCGELFRTKYEMYNHKKNGHR